MPGVNTSSSIVPSSTKGSGFAFAPTTSSTSASTSDNVPSGGGFKLQSAKVPEDKSQTSSKPAGGFQFGAAIPRTSEAKPESTDNNNKSDFGGYKFGQSIKATEKETNIAGPAEKVSAPDVPLAGGLKFAGAVKNLAQANDSKKDPAVEVKNTLETKKDNPTGNFKFEQTVKSVNKETSSDTGPKGVFPFGSTSSVAKSIGSLPKATTGEPSTSDTVNFTFGNKSKGTDSRTSLKQAAPVPSSTETSMPAFNQTNVPAAFSFGKKTDPSVSVPSEQTTSFGTASSKSAGPSSGFVFGSSSATSSASSTSQTPTSTFVFGSAGSKTDLSEKTTQPPESSGSGMFVFGQSSNTTAAAASNTSTGMFSSQPFGGAKLGVNKPGQSLLFSEV